MYQNLQRESAQQLLSELRGQSQPGGQRDENSKFVESPDLPAPRIKADARLSTTDIEKPERLSFLLKLSVFLSILSLAGSVAVISWLWWTPVDDTRWRRWVLTSNRLQLSITLAAMTLRAAVGILATLATAMIASVAAEKHGVPLPEVAHISIARFSNTGPFSLGHLALRSALFKPLVRFLLVLLIITTITTQFTSTLLVSDLEQTWIASFPRSVLNSYNFVQNSTTDFGEATDTGSLHSFWFQRPRSSETLGEYSERPDVGEGFDDTGPTIRAFLPITLQQERESLLSFQGMARVFDSRVICMRPKLENLHLCAAKGDADSHSNLCGSVQLDESVDSVTAGLKWPINERFDFRCPLTAYAAPEMFYHYVWQICGRLASLHPLKEWPLANGTMASNTWVIWDGGKAPTRSQWVKDWAMGHLNTTKSGPWTQPTFWFKYRYMDKPREDNVTFNITLCSVFNMLPGSITYVNVSASSSSPRSEPSLKWNQDKRIFDTSDVRRQLGAVKNGSFLSHQERQILSIDQDKLRQSIAEARNGTAWRKYFGYSQGDWVEDRLIRHQQSYSPMGLCLFCLTWDPSSQNSNADIVYTRLFMDTLAESGSPARAFQALYFMLARNIYYNYATSFIPNFAVPDTVHADIVQSNLVLVPRHFRGYWAVIGTLVVFLATAFASAALFRSTRFSLPENAWHTVAQISNSVEIDSVLRNANVATDDEVRRRIMNEEKLTSHTYVHVFDGFLGILKPSVVSLTSFFDFHSKRDIPRFVVEEGVFVRALGTGAELELNASEAQRRLARRVSGLESLDSR